jgi:hypothetical protein
MGMAGTEPVGCMGMEGTGPVGCMVMAGSEELVGSESMGMGGPEELMGSGSVGMGGTLGMVKDMDLEDMAEVSIINFMDTDIFFHLAQ